MDGVQADVEEQAGEDEPEYPRTRACRRNQQQTQHDGMVQQPRLRQLWWVRLAEVAHGGPQTEGAVGHGVPEIMIDIDQDACCQRYPGIFFEPWQRKYGSSG